MTRKQGAVRATRSNRAWSILAPLVMGMLLATGAGVPPVGEAPGPGASWESVGMSRGFENPPEPWAAGHRGVDLAAQPGDEVRAPADGKVSHVGVVAGRGTISIEVGGGWRTTIEPVEAVVSEGQSVKAGEVIGTVKTGGHCSEQCVHWGLVTGSGHEARYRDPRTLVADLRPSVLWIDATTPPR